MATWKSLEELLQLASGRSVDNAVETSIWQLRSKSISLPLAFPRPSSSSEKEIDPSEPITAIASCRVCKISDFPQGVAQQRMHFKSDWHVYNLSQKHSVPLSEEEFNQMVWDQQQQEEDEEYVSSSSSEEETESEALLEMVVEPKSHFNALPLEFLSKEDLVAKVSTLVGPSAQELAQCLSAPVVTWGIILYRSGHFAAAVYENGKLVQHKTEHRYTTRKKQGGSQASHDTKSSKAKSAGAQLRRYGEQTMRERVTKVLLDWPQWKQCQHVFFTIPERARSLFFAKTLERGDGRFLKRDERCQKIPFMTQRPTLDECERVFLIMSKIELFIQPPQQENAVVVAEMVEAPIVVKLETLQEIELRKAKQDELRYREMGYFDRDLHVACRDLNDGDGLPEGIVNEEDVDAKSLAGQTALHIAVELDKIEFCRTLLYKLGADVTQTDLQGRVPYQLAKLSSIRMLFREYRASKSTIQDGDNGDDDDVEDMEFWRKSQIPEPPKIKTQADLELKREKEREKKKRQVLKKKEEKLAVEAAKLLPPPPPEGPLCGQCSQSVKGRKKKDLFYQGDWVFCQQTCMRDHGRQVMQMALNNRKL
ncbi:hypothetical protein BASA81_004212 [Batrachochytrium salamandrivorans]|nr:hypothetical protein BASA81_004212 [Batrachochytrium salamandrivorans]